MLDIEDFETVFRGNGYNSAITREVAENKKKLGGRTFFERLLELLQIKWRKIYPPSSDEQLQELHDRIVKAPISLHYKHCLFFYLLKDLSPACHDQTELATAFAGQVHLDLRFLTFVQGLWALDHLQLEIAVGYLTHPSIIPTFPDEIMLVLLNQVNSSNHAVEDNKDNILPLAYYNCANPPLVGQEVKTEFVKYMADQNVTETLFWIRTRLEHEQRQLLEVLVEETLGKNTWRTDDGLYTREEKAIEFVSLLFSGDEEKWVETFLTEGKGRNLRGAWDTVEMRRIATGRLREAVNDPPYKGSGRKLDQVNWGILQDSVKRGMGPRKDEEFHLSV